MDLPKIKECRWACIQQCGNDIACDEKCLNDCVDKLFTDLFTPP